MGLSGTSYTICHRLTHIMQLGAMHTVWHYAALLPQPVPTEHHVAQPGTTLYDLALSCTTCHVPSAISMSSVWHIFLILCLSLLLKCFDQRKKCSHVYICTQHCKVHIFLSTSICQSVYLSVCLSVRMCVCVCATMYMYVYIQYVVIVIGEYLYTDTSSFTQSLTRFKRYTPTKVY